MMRTPPNGARTTASSAIRGMPPLTRIDRIRQQVAKHLADRQARQDQVAEVAPLPGSPGTSTIAPGTAVKSGSCCAISAN